MGVGAMFPLASSLHVGASSRNADGAIGQVLSIAALGQISGPLLVGAIAQAAGLRAGLRIIPALILVTGAALAAQVRSPARLALDVVHAVGAPARRRGRGRAAASTAPSPC